MENFTKTCAASCITGRQCDIPLELMLRFKLEGAKFLALEKTPANMSLDGISYQNWYEALKEVRNARSKYFPQYNVVYNHVLATLKNLIVRGLKK